MQHGCMQRNSRKEGPDVWRFAGLRPGLTASVFTERKSSAQSSNTRMKMLRGMLGDNKRGRYLARKVLG
jgi:hypothetical protein